MTKSQKLFHSSHLFEHQAVRRCLLFTCTCFMKIISTPYINAVSTILHTCTSSLYTANALMQRSFYGAEQKSARQGQELLPFSKLKKR